MQKRKADVSKMNEYMRICANINLDSIEKNMQNMKANIGSEVKVISVIKADGYGHGAVPIARMYEKYDYMWGFATATAEEALILRNNNITKPILVLGYVFPCHYEKIVENDIRIAVFNYEMAEMLSKQAVRQNKICRIHIKIDTGMGRIGFLCNDESINEIVKISKLPNIETEGLFAHFAKADEKDKASAMCQLEKYKDFSDKLKENQVDISLHHCSNSAGIIDIKEANLDAVRAGITIYGLYPSDEVKKENVRLYPAMELKSHIVHIKKVPPKTGISYGWTYITDKDSIIATIPVGYADGYPRALSNKGYVLIKGQKAPIVGRVCMDQMMVDITGLKDINLYDEVTLIGNDGSLSISVEELGDLSGRFNYEFVCDIGKRVPRVYYKNGKIIETKEYFN